MFTAYFQIYSGVEGSQTVFLHVFQESISRLGLESFEHTNQAFEHFIDVIPLLSSSCHLGVVSLEQVRLLFKGIQVHDRSLFVLSCFRKRCGSREHLASVVRVFLDDALPQLVRIA